MDAFSAYNYHQFQHDVEGSSSSESGSASPPPADVMLAADHPKKRAGRKKFRETRHPVYRGIRQRNSDKWVCELRQPNKKSRIWLGTFPTAEMAARAHDVAAIALRGRSACLNFADSAWLPVPTSGNTKDIQRAAAEAAEAFCRPQSQPQTVEVEEVKNEDDHEYDIAAFIDEEDLFGMPEIIADMYSGMMLAPPSSAYVADDYVDYEMELSLWSY